MLVTKEQFKQYLTVNAVLEANTIRTYVCRFEIISRWLNVNNLELDRESVSQFLYEKNQEDWAHTTINTYRNTLVKLDEMYEYKGYSHGFTFGTKNLPKQQPEPFWLNKDELKKLLSTHITHPNRNGVDCSDLDFKNLTFTKFLAFTGCRLDEASSLKVKRINIEKGKAYLMKTKNGENRSIFFENYEDLKEDLKRIVSSKTPDDLVFTGSTGHKILPGTFNENIKQRAKLAGIKDWQKIHAHTLRHTYATHLLTLAGVDITLVSKLLGHRDIRTTVDTYIHWEDDILQKAARKHPLLRPYILPKDIVDDFKKETLKKYEFAEDSRFKLRVIEEDGSFELKLLF